MVFVSDIERHGRRHVTIVNKFAKVGTHSVHVGSYMHISSDHHLSSQGHYHRQVIHRHKSGHFLRKENNFNIPHIKTDRTKNSFIFTMCDKFNKSC